MAFLINDVVRYIFKNLFLVPQEYFAELVGMNIFISLIWFKSTIVAYLNKLLFEIPDKVNTSFMKIYIANLLYVFKNDFIVFTILSNIFGPSKIIDLASKAGEMALNKMLTSIYF